MALTFKSVDKNLWGDHSNAVLSCGAVCYAVQVGSNFCQDFCGWKPMVWPFKWKLLSSTFLRYCLWWCHKAFLPIESVDEILQCDHLVTFPVVLFHGTKCFVLFVCLFVFFDLMFDMSGVGEQNGSHSFFFFTLSTTKPAPTSFSYNVLLCVITKNIGSNTVELITDFFPCCSDNDLHRSSLDLIGNALNFLVNSWEIISVWISSPGQSGWWLALDDAS